MKNRPILLLKNRWLFTPNDLFLRTLKSVAVGGRWWPSVAVGGRRWVLSVGVN